MSEAASSSRPLILVTGAARGIGKAIAERLAGRGCRLALHARQNLAAAQALAQSLPGGGHRAFGADLALPQEVALLWDQVTRAMGPVSVVVNNAALYEYHPILGTSYAEWEGAWHRTLEADLLGPVRLSHLAANAMAAAGGGRVVSISSRGAFRGEPEAPAYAAAKAGLNAMSQSLAWALAAQGVYFFVVAPGWVRTDMAAEHLAGPRGPAILAQHPLGRVANPDEVAVAAAFCALDAPAAMTGSILDVNGASYLRT